MRNLRLHIWSYIAGGQLQFTHMPITLKYLPEATKNHTLIKSLIPLPLRADLLKYVSSL